MEYNSNDEMLFYLKFNVAALRHAKDLALKGFLVALHPLGSGDERCVCAGELGELHAATASFTHSNDVARLHKVRRNVDLLAVHGEVTVVDKLACVAAGGSKAETEHDVIETTLQQTKQVSPVMPV